MIPYRRLFAARNRLPEVRVVMANDTWGTLPLVTVFGPTPADWGQWSGGTRNLAAAILRWHLGILPQGDLAHAFAREFLVPAFGQHFELEAQTVEAWLKTHGPLPCVQAGFSQWRGELSRGPKERTLATGLGLDRLAPVGAWRLIWIARTGELVAAQEERFVLIDALDQDEVEAFEASAFPDTVYDVCEFVSDWAEPAARAPVGGEAQASDQLTLL
jgi:hypothetical protein